jgi:hypothetical protein
MYTRVLPRDLFNESKLLKCLGQLALIILDGMDCRHQPVPSQLRIDHDGSPFVIERDDSDGNLKVTNLRVMSGLTEIEVTSCLNSKEPYPLIFEPKHLSELVFNADGSLSAEFLEYANLCH